MATIEGIAVKRVIRGPMELVSRSMVFIDYGLGDDCRGDGGSDRSRQITLISYQQWEKACEELWATPRTMSWVLRRANICLREHTFSEEDVDRYLHIGQSVILEITGETAPCNRMDEIREGLKLALTPDCRGGVTARVIQGGLITKDDAVWWTNPDKH